jgi:ribosomal protein S18 acetylase RimI-like enzyme
VHALVAIAPGAPVASADTSVNPSPGVTGSAVTGIANYLIHENTTSLTPACYLQDLFVDPAFRTLGVGRALIDALWEEVKANGWSRLYWLTTENNYRARALYDKYTPHSGFVRYILRNDPQADSARSPQPSG